MPGMVGLAGQCDFGQPFSSIVRAMCASLKHFDNYVDDEVFTIGPVAGARTTPGVIGGEAQPQRSGGLYVWLYGEFYNAPDLLRDDPHVEEIPQSLVFAKLFEQDPDARFLGKINGTYSAVVYDSDKELAHFITDRFGLQHLYYSEINGALAWASETKAFLAVPGFNAVIDEASIEAFFDLGYLDANDTWFASAKLFPSASWWTWSCAKQKFVKKQHYWRWDHITPLRGEIDLPEIAEELARRFRSAVDVRTRSLGKYGVLLSGGLDSRAAFATLPERLEPIEAVTFGSPASDDVRIATRVAALRRSFHSVLELNENNWLTNREMCVWACDGHLDLLHLHFAPFLREVRSRYDIHIGGFFGDGVSGGSYIRMKRFRHETEVLERRGRRFIGYGLSQERLLGHTRMPFADNDFVSLALSVPTEFRSSGELHIEMLRHLMPKEFCDIPWQKTGTGIAQEHGIPIRILAKQWRAFGRRFRARLGMPSGRHDFHNYRAWCAHNTSRRWFRELFTRGERPLVAQFDTPFSLSLLKKSSFTMQEINVISRAATLELFLQVVQGVRAPPSPAPFLANSSFTS